MKQRRVGGSQSLGIQIMNATNLIQVNPNSFIHRSNFMESASTECSQCWPLSVALVLPNATPWSRWPSCLYIYPPNSQKKTQHEDMDVRCFANAVGPRLKFYHVLSCFHKIEGLLMLTSWPSLDATCLVPSLCHTGTVCSRNLEIRTASCWVGSS